MSTFTYRYAAVSHYQSTAVELVTSAGLAVVIDLPSGLGGLRASAMYLRSRCCGARLNSVERLTYLYCNGCASDTNYPGSTVTIAPLHTAPEKTFERVTGWFEAEGSVLEASLFAEQLITLGQTVTTVALATHKQGVGGLDLEPLIAFLQSQPGAEALEVF